jgi:hypothetical protein
MDSTFLPVCSDAPSKAQPIDAPTPAGSLPQREEEDRAMTDNDNIKYPERMRLDRLPPGTIERIDAVLKPGETRDDFVRAAAKAEITRREAELGQ